MYNLGSLSVFFSFVHARATVSEEAKPCIVMSEHMLRLDHLRDQEEEKD